MRSSFLRRALCLAAAAVPLTAGVASAQQAVGEVTVFAQKREQRLQDIPVAVSAFNQQTLQDAGVRDIRELTVLTPGLLVTSTSNESVTTARIRGVGTVGDNPGLESSVGVVIDGVYRPRNGVGFGDLGEISRIEVLKGPQGTLFGKNTSAGVIQVFTARPQYDWGFNGEATLGEYNTRGLAASVTGPIIDDMMAFRVYGAKRERDGFMDIRTGPGPRTKKDDYDQNFYTLRGQLLFEPTSNLSFTLIGDISKRDEMCCSAVTLRSPNPTAGANATAAAVNGALAARVPGAVALITNLDPYERIAFSNRDTTQDVEDKGVSLEANWDLGFADFTYVGSKRNWTLIAAQDIDYSAADLFYRNADGTNGNEFDTTTHEIRLQGTAENILAGLDWTVGAFSSAEDLTSETSFLYGLDARTYFSAIGAAAGIGTFLAGDTTLLAAGGGTRDVHEQEDRSYAIFTQNTLSLTDRLAATVGIRYTSTDKDLSTVYRTNNGSCDAARAAVLATTLPSAALSLTCITWQNQAFDRFGTLKQSLKEEETTGTAKLAFDVTEDILTFVSYSTGYKAGGFNLDREGGPGTEERDTSFKPEFVDSYEAGIKTAWMDGSLVVNASIFRNEFTDFQLNTFVGTVFAVVSVPEVTSEGFEVDAQWQTPIDGFNLQLGANVSETVYGNFPVSSASALLPGNKMSFAPDYTISGGASYEREFGGNYRFRSSLNGRYTADYSTASDLLPAKNQEAFLLLNGRIGVGTKDERYTFEVFGTNLTNEEYLQVGFNGPVQGSAATALVVGGNPRYLPQNDTITYKGFLSAPRVLGATFRVRY